MFDVIWLILTIRDIIRLFQKYMRDFLHQVDDGIIIHVAKLCRATARPVQAQEFFLVRNT